MDFDEEYSAVSSKLLLRQVNFTVKAIEHVLEKEITKRCKVVSIVLLGHSMGGIVARAAVPLLKQKELVKIVLTVAAPNTRHILNHDEGFMNFYESFDPQTAPVTIAVAGGVQDTMVEPSIAYLPKTYGGISTLSASIATVGVSVDHQASIWCYSMVDVLAMTALKTHEHCSQRTMSCSKDSLTDVVQPLYATADEALGADPCLPAFEGIDESMSSVQLRLPHEFGRARQVAYFSHQEHCDFNPKSWSQKMSLSRGVHKTTLPLESGLEYVFHIRSVRKSKPNTFSRICVKGAVSDWRLPEINGMYQAKGTAWEGRDASLVQEGGAWKFVTAKASKVLLQCSKQTSSPDQCSQWRAADDSRDYDLVKVWGCNPGRNLVNVWTNDNMISEWYDLDFDHTLTIVRSQLYRDLKLSLHIQDDLTFFVEPSWVKTWGRTALREFPHIPFYLFSLILLRYALPYGHHLFVQCILPLLTLIVVSIHNTFHVTRSATLFIFSVLQFLLLVIMLLEAIIEFVWRMLAKAWFCKSSRTPLYWSVAVCGFLTSLLMYMRQVIADTNIIAEDYPKRELILSMMCGCVELLVGYLSLCLHGAMPLRDLKFWVLFQICLFGYHAHRFVIIDVGTPIRFSSAAFHGLVFVHLVNDYLLLKQGFCIAAGTLILLTFNAPSILHDIKILNVPI